MTEEEICFKLHNLGDLSAKNCPGSTLPFDDGGESKAFSKTGALTD